MLSRSWTPDRTRSEPNVDGGRSLHCLGAGDIFCLELGLRGFGHCEQACHVIVDVLGFAENSRIRFRCNI